MAKTKTKNKAKWQLGLKSSSGRKTSVNVKLLLKGASILEEFITSSQIDKNTNKQKYIGTLESYLTESGNVHLDSTNASCFKTSVSSLESLNSKFKNLETDVTKLAEAMREVAKNYMEIEYGSSSDSKMKSILAEKGSFVSAAEINAFVNGLSEADKKALAAFLQAATGAEICVSSGLISKLSSTKAGKNYVKKYIKTDTKTTKTAVSKAKVSKYAPTKYLKAYGTTKAARAAWKKDLVEDFKNRYNLSDKEAKELASQKMKAVANRNINKAKIEVSNKRTSVKNAKVEKINSNYKNEIAKIEKQAQKYDNARDKQIDAVVKDDKAVKTDPNSLIKERNEDTGSEKVVEPTKPVEQPQPSPPEGGDTTQPVVDGDGNTVVDQVQEGGYDAQVGNEGQQLPEENPYQESGNFQEAVDEQRAGEVTNEIDETADTTSNDPVGSDLADGDEGEGLDGLEDTDSGSDGTHTTIPSSSDSDGGSVSSKKSGTSPVIPIVAGVAAAGAAGVGAKIILDRRTNTVNDGNFGSEDWTDSSDSDYGLSSDSEYFNDNTSDKDLLEEDSDNNYDYKASSIDEVNVDEKEKADEEADKLSFHDNIAYEAINEAEADTN